MPPVRRSKRNLSQVEGDSDVETLPHSSLDKLIAKFPFSSSSRLLRTRAKTSLSDKTVSTLTRKNEYLHRLKISDRDRYDTHKAKDADRKRKDYKPIALLKKNDKESQREQWRLAKVRMRKKSSKVAVMVDAPEPEVVVPQIRVKDMTAAER